MSSTERPKEKKSEHRQSSPLTSLVAGGIAGGVEAAVTYPLEFAKTRVQLRSDGPVTRNPYAAVSQVYRTEGVRALYKGCSTLIIGSIGKDAVRFLTFDSIKKAFADPETGALTPINNLLAVCVCSDESAMAKMRSAAPHPDIISSKAKYKELELINLSEWTIDTLGMSSGVVASATAVTPTERIKTALIDDAKTGKGRFESPIHAVRLLVAEQGLIRGLYRGFVGNTLKQATATSVRLGVYNIIKEAERSRDIQQTTVVTLLNGAVTGTIVVYVTQPFDCIKTRSQSAKGAGVSEAIRDIRADNGIRGFWRGSTMRLGRVVLSASILFTTYEWIAALVQPIVE